MYAIIYNVVSTPRERMVVSAALLIRERGAHATAISDVLEHSGAPRGSAYHYFPGGRTQLLCEAIDYAGEYIAAQDLRRRENALELLDNLVDKYRRQLLRSDYRAGCPIVAVTVEAGDPDDRDASTKVIERAAAVFARWTDLIAQRLLADGCAAPRAEELAMLVTTSHRGRDRRRPGIPRRQTPRSRSSPAARTAAGRDAPKGTPAMTSDWQSTACILCECNCGIVVQLEGRTLAKIRGDKEHPASQGYTCNKALRLDHYQNNRSTADVSDAPTPRRQLRGNRLGHRDRRDRRGLQAHPRHLRRRQDLLLRRRRAGQPSGRGLQRARSSRRSGPRYRSNALAQEKTGEAWVDAHLYGGHTRGEFEHAEVSVFIGKNPWMSQSFPRARTVLNEIAKDPARSMIVIDPVITDTAKMADFHLRVRPGTDAWCLAALAAVLVQENLCNEAFLAEHVQRRRRRPRRAARGPGRRLRATLRRRRGIDPHRGAAHRRRRQRGGVRGPRASSRRPTARCART